MGILSQKQSRWTKHQELAFKKTFGVSDTVVTKWKAEGFTFVNASAWAEWKVSASRASRLRADGHTKAPSRRFQDSRVSLTKALEWTQAGFRPETARPWIELGVTADDARDLRDCGWVLSDLTQRRRIDFGFEDKKATVARAIGFSEAGFYYESHGIRPPARPWFEIGVSGWEAVDLLGADWSATEITELLVEALTQADLSVTPKKFVGRVLEFVEAEFNKVDTRDWILCGAAAWEANRLIAAGWSAGAVKELVEGALRFDPYCSADLIIAKTLEFTEAGLNRFTSPAWILCGAAAWEANRLIAAGWSDSALMGLVQRARHFDPSCSAKVIIEKAVEFTEAGFNLVDTRDLILCGADLNLVKQFLEVGVSLEQSKGWILYEIDATSARDALAAGWTIDEVEAALNLDIEVDKVLEWVKAGLQASSALQWMERSIPLDKALKYKVAGIDHPPHHDFSYLGVTIDEAIQWEKHGFTADTADEFIDCGLTPKVAASWIEAGFETQYDLTDSNRLPGFGWKIWYQAGFSPTSAMKFRTKLLEFAISYAQLPHDTSKSPARDDEWLLETGQFSSETTLCGILIESMYQLAQVGIEVTIDSVFKWRGIQASWILAAIDNGIDPDDVYEMGSASLTADSREMFKVIEDLGTTFLPALPATWFIEHGFTTSEVNQLIKQEIDLSEFIVVSNRSDVDPKTMLKWAVAGWNVTTTCWLDRLEQSVIVPWVRSGFTAKEAIKWNSEMISAELAKEWRDSGLDDPVIAKRRIQAGLRPRNP